MTQILYPLVIAGLLAVVIYSFYAQLQVQHTFRKYEKVSTRSGYTGAQVAEKLLRSRGIYDVTIEMVAGHLSDHYDPKHKTLRLSDAVYHGTGIAALGVAAHEAGHAIQYAENYVPVRLRMVIIPAVTFGSHAFYLLLVLGALLSFPPLIALGILCFALVTFFQFVTLPVEFNASRRALDALKNEIYLDEAEQTGAKKVLSAAAMTYVAAFAMSLLQLIRLILIFRSDDR